MAELTRRGLLARAGLATGAVALGRVERVEAAPDLTDWGAVRAQFALAANRVHLTSFLLAAHPRPVREAIDRHRAGSTRTRSSTCTRTRARLTAEARAAARPLSRRAAVGDRAHRLDDDGARPALHAARAATAATRSLTTEHDFYATHESLRLRRRARSGGCAFTTTRAGLLDEIVRRLRRRSPRVPGSSRSPGCTRAPA